MVKKAVKKARKSVKPDRFSLIEKELHKRTKAELVAMILMIARKQSDVMRDLENQLNIDKPVDLLVNDVACAISVATDFDERMMNHNFDVDWQAYADVRKGLEQLIASGHLDDAKSLALQLMKEGSYQVECSDEGLMTEDICECLRPVIRAVKAAGGDAAGQWAKKMLDADRMGFICNKELAELRGKS